LDELPLTGESKADTKPDIVISLRVSKQNTKARYSARARDSNDSDEKFERRFAEYEVETLPVEETYRQHGILIDVGDALHCMGSVLTVTGRRQRNERRKPS
jgi:adenylate kinase family enzyme